MVNPSNNIKKKTLNAIIGISQNSFKNSSLLITASVVAQIVNFIGYPFITRSIDPQEFGKFALLLSCVSVFSVFSFGRLELLFPKCKNPQERFELLTACVLFFTLTILLLLIALQFSELLFSFTRIKRFDYWSGMIIISYISMSLLNLMNSYKIGLGIFKILSLLRFLQAFSTIIFTLLFIRFTSGYIALFWGLNLGNAICLIWGSLNLFFVQRELNGKFNWNKSLKILKENKKMIFLNSPHALLDSLQTNLLNVVIGRYYSITAVGNYSLANRLIRAPMSTVGGAISQVFYKDIHGFESSSIELKNYVKKILYILLFLSVLLMGFFVFFFKLFFVKIFGENWKGVIPVVYALIPWVVANFVSSPLSQLTIYKNRQGSAMVFGVLYNALTLLSLLSFGVLNYNLVENIFWTSCVGGGLNIAFILWIFRILNYE